MSEEIGKESENSREKAKIVEKKAKKEDGNRGKKALGERKRTLGKGGKRR